MKSIGLLVARLGSTRLPRKALKPLAGKAMIERLAERARAAKSLSEVAVATTTLPEDAELCAFAQKLGLRSFRGSPDNVSLRMAQAAEGLGADAVVELLADNPLIPPDLIDAAVEKLSQGADYAATVTKEYPDESSRRLFPVGVRVQAYTKAAAEAWKDYPEFLNGPLGTTAFLFKNPARFKLSFVEAQGPWKDCSEKDWTFAVNYQRNFDLSEKVFTALGGACTLPQVCAWMRAHPEHLPLMEQR